MNVPRRQESFGLASLQVAGIAFAVAAVTMFSALQTVQVVDFWVQSGGGADWPNLVGATQGNPYDTPGYRWSPVAAWVLTALVPLGLPIWQVAHLAVLALLRPYWMAFVVLAWWAFWHDVMNGNLMTFVFVAGWLALRGNRAGTYASYALVVLMPRPLLLPLTAWLLYRQADTRVGFALIFAAHFGLVVLSGYSVDWVQRLLETAGPEMMHPWNWLPSQWIGIAWLPFGLVLAAALTSLGWVGAASILAAPYVFPYYWMVVLWDVPRVLRWLSRQPLPAAVREAMNTASLSLASN
jgi:hypothetical protein